MDHDTSTGQPSTRLGDLSRRVLFKTLLKCVLWFGLAWLATSVFPGIVWPWYVAWAFVAIGMAFSLVALAAAFASRKIESGQ